jgi:hypothetical protein
LDWIEAVKVLGAPGALLLAGLAWLATDRARILAELRTANDDRLAYRDKRATELQAATREYAEYGEGLGERLRTMEAKLDRLLERTPAR